MSEEVEESPGYRLCFSCGRLMRRDDTPSRYMTEEERSIQPCVEIGDVCVECAVKHPPFTHPTGA